MAWSWSHLVTGHTEEGGIQGSRPCIRAEYMCRTYGVRNCEAQSAQAHLERLVQGI
jgi:hypothetical protein